MNGPVEAQVDVAFEKKTDGASESQVGTRLFPCSLSLSVSFFEVSKLTLLELSGTQERRPR